METKLRFYPSDIWQADLHRHGDTGAAITLRVLGTPPVSGPITLAVDGGLPSSCCSFPATVKNNAPFRVVFDAELVTLHGFTYIGLRATAPGYPVARMRMPTALVNAVTTGQSVAAFLEHEA